MKDSCWISWGFLSHLLDSEMKINDWKIDWKACCEGKHEQMAINTSDSATVLLRKKMERTHRKSWERGLMRDSGTLKYGSWGVPLMPSANWEVGRSVSNFQSEDKRLLTWWLLVWFLESKTGADRVLISTVYTHSRRNSSCIGHCFLQAISWLDGVCSCECQSCPLCSSLLWLLGFYAEALVEVKAFETFPSTPDYHLQFFFFNL